MRRTTADTAQDDSDGWPGEMPDPARPVLIHGPTASGKSALALALARAQGRCIVNADAIQVFADWRILSARPTVAEEALCRHRLFGHVGWHDPWSVGHWLRETAEVLSEAPAAAPVLVGGTGLYFTALTEGLAPIPPTPAAIRAEADALRARAGIAALRETLDPETAARIDLANPARVQRAWEVLRATGRGLADWQAATPPPLLPRDRAAAFVIDAPPAALARRIAARFHAMLAEGALEEVRAILPRWDPRLPAARAIGAAELVAVLRGETDLATATDSAITATRQFAKRQRSWARNRLGDWTRLRPVWADMAADEPEAGAWAAEPASHRPFQDRRSGEG